MIDNKCVFHHNDIYRASFLINLILAVIKAKFTNNRMKYLK